MNAIRRKILIQDYLLKYLLVSFVFFLFWLYVITCKASEPVVQDGTKTIHVLVALCDNQHQGIVKVPKAIGNGQDPGNNLYWGCSYGVRTYFKKSADWTEVAHFKIDSIKLERIVLKYKKRQYYLVADAYNGKYIKQATVDLLNSCSGALKDSIIINGQRMGILGNAEVLAYIGHNGLMDFSLNGNYSNKDGNARQVIILACASRQYFKNHIKNSGAIPLLWTTHLMAPEAYTLHDALSAYINGNSSTVVRDSAAAAYSKYQKCSIKAARNLLVTGY